MFRTVGSPSDEVAGLYEMLFGTLKFPSELRFKIIQIPALARDFALSRF